MQLDFNFNVVKTCSKCKQNKAAEDFNKGRPECKECQKEYKKAYYEQNREKIKERKKAYRKQNSEKIKEQKKAYYEQNAEKLKEYQKAYRKQNPEKIKERTKAYRKQNREKIKERKKAYRKQNAEKIKEQGKAYYEQNREKIKAWREQNAEKIKERHKAYREQNREKIKERKKAYRKQNAEKLKGQMKAYHKQNRDKARIYQRNKRKTDPNFRLANNLRGRVRQALNGKSKSKNTLKLLGCSVDFLKKYLENQFQAGMSWDNYGYNGWHIDHILPCASFDLSDPKQQQKCFHYSNLQPLWAKDNISKGAKIN